MMTSNTLAKHEVGIQAAAQLQGEKWVMASVSGIVYQELQPGAFKIQVLE